MRKKAIYLAGLLMLQLNCSSCFETCEEATLRIDKPTDFQGEIDSVFLNPKKKNQPCVIVNGQEYLIYNPIYSRFSKGDF